jgi:hypothetical protein
MIRKSMMRTGIALAALVVLAAATAGKTQNAQRDLFTYAAGARLISVPPDSDMSQMAWSPLNLIDDSARTDWLGEGSHAVFVLELAESTRLSRIAFDTAGLNRDAKSPRNFTVEVSETSPASGFHPVLNGSLQMARNNQTFTFKEDERPIARWVRLTLHDNYGDEYQGMMGFRGYGEQLTHDAALTGITGNYDGASGWGWIHLVQSGDRVSGCYEFQKGSFDGVIDGRVMRLTMREDGGEPQTGLFQFSPDGRKLVGIARGQGPANRDNFASYYSAEKTGNRAGSC